jgi:hypothetical protein
VKLTEAFIILAQLHDDLPTGTEGMWVPTELVEAILPLASMGQTEYGEQLTNGGYQIRPTDKYIERIFPLREWIEAKQRHGRVGKRTIIVVTDWKNLPKGAKS